MNDKRLLLLFCFSACIIGIGLSLVSWGDPDGISGRGWPVPTEVRGIPENAEEQLSILTEIGAFGFVLNAMLAVLAGMVLWALVKLVLRFTGRT